MGSGLNLQDKKTNEAEAKVDWNGMEKSNWAETEVVSSL